MRLHSRSTGLSSQFHLANPPDRRNKALELDRLPALAVELVRRQIAVLVATGGAPPAFAAKTATATIPIVFIVGEDPVRLGLVASLARPESNLTGINFFNSELSAKRLEFLRELIPTANHVGVLVNPVNAANTETTLRDVEPAARATGLQVQVFNASTSREIDAAFASLRRERTEALFVGIDPFFTSRRIQIVQLAAHYSIPASYSGREITEVGGLMSYGTNIAETFRQVGVYAGRTSRGPSRRTCRSNRHPSSSWLSTPRQPGCSAWICHQPCSPAPTR